MLLTGFIRKWAFYALVMILISCNTSPVKEDLNGDSGTYDETAGFAFKEIPGGYEVTVTRPWQGHSKTAFQYRLIRDACQNDDSLDHQVISIPLNRVVCTSTTHIAFLKALGVEHTIVGISGKNLVSDSIIRKKIREQAISDIGYDAQLDYEQLLTLNPDVIFLYGIDKKVTGTIAKIENLGIPVILVGDYLAPDFKSRLSWINFFALFFDIPERGRIYCDSVIHRYDELKLLVSGKKAPDVMTGLPWNEVWYIAGKGSAISSLISDAGGNYLFDRFESPEAIPVDIEKVLSVAREADIWINPGDAESLNDIMAMDPRLALFEPFRNDKVYNNNRKLNGSGGNDYWESGVVHPDQILEDLIAVFHPEVLKNHEFSYFRKLEQK